jgi:hypothetical protein
MEGKRQHRSEEAVPMTRAAALTEPDPDRLLNAALRRAALGQPVFPCIPDAKRPLTTHGLLDASTDPDQIRHWWAHTPTANLAVPTGPTSYDVLDIDLHPTGSGYPALNRLIRAGIVHGYSHVVLTPSGGMHAYFPGTDQPSSRLPSQHLDFKATGGYVLAPPSVVGGHPYELIRRTNGPHLPLDWADVHTLLAPPHPTPATRTVDLGIEPLARWVARLPEGQRNAGTFWAACRAIENGHHDLRPLIDAAVTAGLPHREAARTVSSALRRTTSPGEPATRVAARTRSRRWP